MTLFGIELHKPSFNELTASAVLAAGLWVGVVGLARASGHALQSQEAGALLVLSVWGCIAARIGLSIDKSRLHFVCNMGIGGVLLTLYQAAATLMA